MQQRSAFRFIRALLSIRGGGKLKPLTGSGVPAHTFRVFQGSTPRNTSRPPGKETRTAAGSRPGRAASQPCCPSPRSRRWSNWWAKSTPSSAGQADALPAGIPHEGTSAAAHESRPPLVSAGSARRCSRALCPSRRSGSHTCRNTSCLWDTKAKSLPPPRPWRPRHSSRR